MAHDQEDGAGRRFLDDLEERVGAGNREILGAVDDADPVAAIGGRGPEDRERAPDGIDRDGRGRAFLVRGRRPAQNGEIRVGQRRDLTRRRRIRADIQVSDPRPGPGREIQKRASDPVGQGCLADPVRATDQPGMVKAAVPEAFHEGRLPFRMPEEGKLFSRMGRLRRAGPARPDRVHATSRCALGSVRSGQRSRRIVQIAASTSSGSRSASTIAHRFGFLAAMSRNA